MAMPAAVMADAAGALSSSVCATPWKTSPTQATTPSSSLSHSLLPPVAASKRAAMAATAAAKSVELSSSLNGCQSLGSGLAVFGGRRCLILRCSNRRKSSAPLGISTMSLTPGPSSSSSSLSAMSAEAAKMAVGQKTKLQQLFLEQGQSPWLDNLSRGFIATGQLKEWIDKGVRGVTSNPTIFQKSISSTSDYDDQFTQLIRDGSSVDAAYWSLVVKDIQDALDVFKPLYDETGGEDGYVSVEVAPSLAHDTQGTIENARQLHKEVGRPNVYIKIPATKAGIPAIRQAISEGISVNVTLIFSIERYEAVFDAFVEGLEDHKGEDLSKVSSVASFFVSRVDSEVDKRLTEIGTPEALSLRGKTAVAQAQLAYDLFKTKCADPRWKALAARGAKVQRPLWASTGVKNKAYPDTLYVDTLIGPDTVNTLPDATLQALFDHGTIERTVDKDIAAAKAVIEGVERQGISLADVAEKLEAEGVASFAKSFDDLMASLIAKGALLRP